MDAKRLGDNGLFVEDILSLPVLDTADESLQTCRIVITRSLAALLELLATVRDRCVNTSTAEYAAVESFDACLRRDGIAETYCHHAVFLSVVQCDVGNFTELFTFFADVVFDVEKRAWIVLEFLEREHVFQDHDLVPPA